MIEVYLRKNNRLLRTFPTRKDAVYWCKVNQLSPYPNGTWTDDYYLRSEGNEDS